MQIICPLLLATSWSLTDKDWLNPQSMSFNILYKSLLLILKALVWFSPPWSGCWVAESCLGLSERQRGVCWEGWSLPQSCHQHPLCNLQIDFYLLFINFFYHPLFGLLSFIFLRKELFFWWCSPCSSVSSVIQPHSFTAAGKWRDGAVSQEEALSIALFCDQTKPIWEPFPIPEGWDLPSCRSALAGVGSRPWREVVGWDQEPLWPCRSQCSKWNPAWHWCQCEGWFWCPTMMLLVQESILEEFWEKPVLVCAEFCALSKLMPLFCLCKSLSKSDFHPQWNRVWGCSTPEFVPWEAAMTWNISLCLTLCKHKADPSLLHWTFVRHLRSCVEITAEYFGCISLVTIKAQCECLLWKNLEGVMSLCWRLRGFDFFFLFRETCLF